MLADVKIEMVCRNIRNLRKYYRLSRKEMAKRLHIGVETLRKIECGKIPPRMPLTVLIEIYRCFGFTPSQIITSDVLQLQRLLPDGSV